MKLVASRADLRTGPILAALVLTVAGCTNQPSIRDSAPGNNSSPPVTAVEPIPRPEPRSRYGNGPVYEVYGQRYEVLDSNDGYVERGVASWYGKKFHGRPTSSREPYDMYQMTAAHKSLPLPSFVEVRNLENDRSIIVRVNDRGPFVKNRLIDLSYAAALKLDIVQNGTGMVEVRAISFQQPSTNSAPSITPTSTETATEHPALTGGAHRIYLQVGAFGDKVNAERRHRLISRHGIEQVFVHREADRSPAIYRVRIGPLSGVQDYDRVVGELAGIGIDDSHLVTE